MASNSISNRTSIVGIGHTEYSKDSGRSELKLACEAIGAALSDAGLEPRDVDGITKFTMDNNDPIDIARNLGIPELRFTAEVAYGGGGGPLGTVLLAAMAVATGQGVILLDEVQVEGKKRVSARDFVNGHQPEMGQLMEAESA